MPELGTIVQENRESPRWIRLQKNVSMASVADQRSLKVAKVALTPGNANAYAVAWQNPESNAILITRVVLDVTTAAAAAAVLDVGSAANGTTNSDNIFVDAALNAVATLDHNLVGGAGAGGVQKLAAKGGATDYITGQILTQNATDVVGYLYIEYIEV